jgi:hypothetical protein
VLGASASAGLNSSEEPGKLAATAASTAAAADGRSGAAGGRLTGSGVGGIEAWGVLEEAEGVEALMGSCDVRGVREKELKGNLEKVSMMHCVG